MKIINLGKLLILSLVISSVVASENRVVLSEQARSKLRGRNEAALVASSATADSANLAFLIGAAKLLKVAIKVGTKAGAKAAGTAAKTGKAAAKATRTVAQLTARKASGAAKKFAKVSEKATKKIEKGYRKFEKSYEKFKKACKQYEKYFDALEKKADLFDMYIPDQIPRSCRDAATQFMTDEQAACFDWALASVDAKKNFDSQIQVFMDQTCVELDEVIDEDILRGEWPESPMGCAYRCERDIAKLKQYYPRFAFSNQRRECVQKCARQSVRDLVSDAARHVCVCSGDGNGYACTNGVVEHCAEWQECSGWMYFDERRISSHDTNGCMADLTEGCDDGNNDQCFGSAVCGRFNRNPDQYQCCKYHKIVGGVYWCANWEGDQCSQGENNNCQDYHACGESHWSPSGYHCCRNYLKEHGVYKCRS